MNPEETALHEQIRGLCERIAELERELFVLNQIAARVSNTATKLTDEHAALKKSGLMVPALQRQIMKLKTEVNTLCAAQKLEKRYAT